ncbi:MAG: hypothetical protein CK427_16920 [Leptospira sp.]|nr:MAG: hypothetical protein CK427_16920 [Leptospira sp.]
MSYYILVEGKKTELKVYPEWIKHLNPTLTRIYNPTEAIENNYFIISGEGYPNLIDNHLRNAIKDFIQNPNFKKFILCLDCDVKLESELHSQIDKIIDEYKTVQKENVIVIFQKKTIESWFLANRKIFKKNPENEELKKIITHYNVCEEDPCHMEKPASYPGSIGDFHTKYLKLIFQERKISYSKKNPGCVKEYYYFQQLFERFKETGHISEFGQFIEIFTN